MLKGFLVGGAVVLFAALPGTDNYRLRDYGFGSGGGTVGTDNYSLEGLAGELAGGGNTSNTYGLRPGLLSTQLANLPNAPSWQNPDDWYNKLHLIIDATGNPGDATYAVAISDDNFATTRYVQSDNTVGSALGPEDFRDYASWGAGSGLNVIGLTPDTNYQVKVKARQGEFSETGFGPVSSAATAQVSLIFDIDVSASDEETGAPYGISFGSVLPETVTDSPQNIWLDIDSNGESGVFVYVVSDNAGLSSAATGHTISSVTGDLGSIGEGLGAQGGSFTQSAGGPLAAASPFNGTSSSVGGVDGQFRQLLSSSGPVDNGRASFLIKLKTSGSTPAASDYSDIYTFIATAAF